MPLVRSETSTFKRIDFGQQLHSSVWKQLSGFSGDLMPPRRVSGLLPTLLDEVGSPGKQFLRGLKLIKRGKFSSRKPFNSYGKSLAERICGRGRMLFAFSTYYLFGNYTNSTLFYGEYRSSYGQDLIAPAWAKL